jgi:hypothetical protein
MLAWQSCHEVHSLHHAMMCIRLHTVTPDMRRGFSGQAQARSMSVMSSSRERRLHDPIKLQSSNHRVRVVVARGEANRAPGLLDAIGHRRELSRLGDGGAFAGPTGSKPVQSKRTTLRTVAGPEAGHRLGARTVVRSGRRSGRAKVIRQLQPRPPAPYGLRPPPPPPP